MGLTGCWCAGQNPQPSAGRAAPDPRTGRPACSETHTYLNRCPEGRPGGDAESDSIQSTVGDRMLQFQFPAQCQRTTNLVLSLLLLASGTRSREFTTSVDISAGPHVIWAVVLHVIGPVGGGSIKRRQLLSPPLVLLLLPAEPA